VVLAVSRVVWLLTGVAWGARSVIGFAGPDYWEPETALDWASIWSYSIAWLLTAPAVLLIGRAVPSRSVLVAAIVTAVGAVMAGAANGIEDGFGMSSLGTWYVVGFFVGAFGILAMALLLGRAKYVRLAQVCGAFFVGVLLLPLGGGLIVLAVLAWLAAQPDRFLARDPRVTST
jgi:hypothetical protein